MTPDQFVAMSLTVQDGVGLITFNRPERRNAWAGRTAAEYRWALYVCENEPAVRAVVVTGDTDFCVGADSGALADIDSRGGGYAVDKVDLPPYPPATPSELRHNHLYPLALSVPVIAAICGGCAGAGFVVATYADIRFADPDSRIASSFAALGLPAEYGIGWILPRMVGLPNAARLVYAPGPISAEQAAKLGWVQTVSESGRVVDDAVRYARELAAGSSPESLRLMKRALFVDSMFGAEQAYQLSVADMNRALGSADFREGVRALNEKRAPNFLPSSKSM
jgi:enoyl-CoA hydratase/carnithine racemase